MKYQQCADCGKPLDDPVHDNVPNPTAAHHVFAYNVRGKYEPANDTPPVRKESES